MSSPTAVTVDGVRKPFGEVLGPALLAVAWCGGLLAFVIPMAVRRYRHNT